MQGDPQSQRPVSNTLQAHKTGPTFKGDGRGTQSRCRGIPESQRTISSTLQARKLARPPSRENLKTELCADAGDLQSQRSVCDTLPKQVPLST